MAMIKQTAHVRPTQLGASNLHPHGIVSTLASRSTRMSSVAKASGAPTPSETSNVNVDRHSEINHQEFQMSRRQAGLALAGLVAGQAFLAPQPAEAIQGLVAGRIPGVSTTADADGFYTYTRPEGKSGGHGVGWSEVPRYSFKIPAGWEEKPVSIADLGGAEIDLRYTNKDEGDISVVVAPVLRFYDAGFNANIRIENIGEPERVISGFAPELYGSPLDEDEILEISTEQHGGLTYYYYTLKRNRLVAATAVKNRLFILAMRANSRQWKKHEGKLRAIQKSFNVPLEVVKNV